MYKILLYPHQRNDLTQNKTNSKAHDNYSASYRWSSTFLNGSIVFFLLKVNSNWVSTNHIRVVLHYFFHCKNTFKGSYTSSWFTFFRHFHSFRYAFAFMYVGMYYYKYNITVKLRGREREKKGEI